MRGRPHRLDRELRGVRQRLPDAGQRRADVHCRPLWLHLQ
jgi:hypothetical protein